MIVGLLAECIMNNRIRSVCDYGCGDGEYIRLLVNYLKHSKTDKRIIEWGGVRSFKRNDKTGREGLSIC